MWICFRILSLKTKDTSASRWLFDFVKKSHFYFRYIWIFVFHSYPEFRIIHRIKRPLPDDNSISWRVSSWERAVCLLVFNKRVHNPLILLPGILVFGIILFKRQQQQQQHLQVSCNNIWNWIMWTEFVCLHNIIRVRLKHFIVSVYNHIKPEFEFLFERFDLVPSIKYCCI